MDKKKLPDLLSDLEQELIRLGYAENTMKFFQGRWKQLADFAQKRGELYYTEQLGIDFALEYFGIAQDDFGRTRILTPYETRKLRAIRMVGDFQMHRAILRRYYKHKKILTDLVFIETIDRFKAFCIEKEYSNATINNYAKQSTYFMDYLSAQRIFEFKDITIDIINAYIRTLVGYQDVNVCITALKAFFRFLNQEGTITTDFADQMPVVKTRKQTIIPSVWTHEELKKLINAIDRGSPKGKRDYAMILIACRLGLRCTDIKNLCFDNFRWVEKKLCFIQSKTKREMELPLVDDVGWAVIDYLKHGRPKVDSQYIFIRHLAPFLPFSEGSHLERLIKSYMEKAHIPTLRKRRGMHSLRHTMASCLLEKDTPLPVISDILGHLDTNSTAVYLKVDMKRLAECPLDFEEVIEVE